MLINDKIILQSNNNFKQYFLILLFGGLGFVAIGIYLATSFSNSKYPDLFGLGLGAFFLILGLISLYSILVNFNTITIYQDRFEVKSILGFIRRTIYLNEIIYWTEIKKETKTLKWFDLTIVSKNSKQKISSSIYLNYDGLKSLITKGKKRNSQNEKLVKSKVAKYFGYGFIAFGLLSLYGAYYVYQNRYSQEVPQETLIISDIIINKAEIKKGSKGSRHIHILLKKYPEFIFSISGVALSATYASDFENQVKIGDTLKVEISKDIYLKKIAKSKELEFWDKYSNYSFISILGLSYKESTYLTYDDLIKEDKSDSSFVIVFILIFALYMFYNGRKLTKIE